MDTSDLALSFKLNKTNVALRNDLSECSTLDMPYSVLFLFSNALPHVIKSKKTTGSNDFCVTASHSNLSARY